MKAKKDKPLNERQRALLKLLSECNSGVPYIPLSAAEQSTFDALDRRGFIDGDLFEVSSRMTSGGTLRHFKRGGWLSDKGTKALKENAT